MSIKDAFYSYQSGAFQPFSGSGFSFQSNSMSISISPTAFTDVGSFVIKVKATDTQLTSGEASFTVTVTNTAPYMSPAPANVQFPAGTTKILDFSSSLKDAENNQIFV